MTTSSPFLSYNNNSASDHVGYSSHLTFSSHTPFVRPLTMTSPITPQRPSMNNGDSMDFEYSGPPHSSSSLPFAPATPLFPTTNPHFSNTTPTPTSSQNNRSHTNTVGFFHPHFTTTTTTSTTNEFTFTAQHTPFSTFSEQDRRLTGLFSSAIQSNPTGRAPSLITNFSSQRHILNQPETTTPFSQNRNRSPFSSTDSQRGSLFDLDRPTNTSSNTTPFSQQQQQQQQQNQTPFAHSQFSPTSTVNPALCTYHHSSLSPLNSQPFFSPSRTTTTTTPTIFPSILPTTVAPFIFNGRTIQTRTPLLYLAQLFGSRIGRGSDNLWCYFSPTVASVVDAPFPFSPPTVQTSRPSLVKQVKFVSTENAGLQKYKWTEKCSKKECGVCLEDFTAEVEVTELPCKHIFCSECILQWLKKKNTCCLCRAVVPNSLFESTEDVFDRLNPSALTRSRRRMLSEELREIRRQARETEDLSAHITTPSLSNTHRPNIMQTSKQPERTIATRYPPY
eukprot:TRINITY_DN276_c0_g2_i2.p1 TRINITY_DN276_c0_g2~~TRINITY_DN276_c0_g2_i2.p1  ORF type:complete len:504 (+),score=103.54 TRINITY_DN276_c0_g2_i2:328-1839(+)